MNTNKSGGSTPLDFTKCPHWGKGGSYTADPETGLRTRVSDAPTAIDTAPASAPEAGQSPVKPSKEKKE